MDHLAPILLFVYNRPDHTAKTLFALQNNELSKDSELIIYADGPKIVTDENEKDKIKNVRKLINEINGFKSVTIYESKDNKGLAGSIIQGVTETIKKYGKAIVLEDDIITSPGFLNYMNDSLNLYEHEKKVMHISGYMFPVKKKLPPTFFLNTASCWGWATWERAWKHLILDSGYLIKKIYERDLVSKINLNNTYDHFNSLIANHEGTQKTWAIFWHCSMALKDGYCLHPYPSLTKNIGHDSSGENCKQSDNFNWDKLADSIVVGNIKIQELGLALKAIKRFYKSKKSFSMRGLIGDWVYTNMSDSFIIKLKAIFEKSTKYEYQEIKKLSTYPRYLSGETNLTGNKIKFVDAKSTIFSYNEIFKNNVYAFKTSAKSLKIIDCGANIGLSTIYFKQNFPKAQIIAFEPDKEIFDVLQHNVKSSHHFNDVTLVNAALWLHNNGINFKNDGADGGKVTFEDSGTNVSTCKLSEYLDSNVDFLKMDIEGAEYEVLKECGDKLSSVRQMFIEYHSFEDRSQNLQKILELLSQFNFRYYMTMPGLKSSNPLIKLNKYAGMDMQVNIYAKNLS